MQYLHKIHQIKEEITINCNYISEKNQVIIVSRTQLVIVIVVETERIFVAQSNGRIYINLTTHLKNLLHYI